MYVFITKQGGFQNNRRSSRLILVTVTVPWKMDVKFFSYVYSSRKHWTCKYRVVYAEECLALNRYIHLFPLQLYAHAVHSLQWYSETKSTSVQRGSKGSRKESKDDTVFNTRSDKESVCEPGKLCIYICSIYFFQMNVYLKVAITSGFACLYSLL